MNTKKLLIITCVLTIQTACFSQDIIKLLDLSKGYPVWAQTRNNDGTCNPSYNEFFESTDNENCTCGKYPAGCGAIAMGQIMYYWEWPLDYQWDIIPNALYSNTPEESANELTQLIYDCAEKMNMHYMCVGSWAYTNDFVSALHEMGYEAATKHKKSSWSNNAWGNLVRTEIDAGRPVVFRGGEVIELGDMGSVHYFICDGYEQENTNKFHFNWGWGDHIYTTSDYYTFSLDNLTPATYNFTNEQQVIIGISPTCNQPENNIYSVPYAHVQGYKEETAVNNIILPANNPNLIVENGANYMLTAGNAVVLKPGFHAKAGSNFIARIRNVDECNCGGDLNVSEWTNVFTPNNDGYNDELCLIVSNANTYTIEVFDRNGYNIYQGAGIINDELACVWDGEGIYNSSHIMPSEHGNYLITTVYPIISFYNNCGQKVDQVYAVTVIFPENNEKKYALDNENMISISRDGTTNNNFEIYPNPSNGLFYLNSEIIDFSNQYRFEIYSTTGKLIKKDKQSSRKIDIRGVTEGMYLLEIYIDNQIFNKKIIIKE